MKHCEPIKWQTWEPMTPEDFPCMICNEREAVVAVNIEDGILPMNLTLCVFCAGFPEQELVSRILKKEKP